MVIVTVEITQIRVKHRFGPKITYFPVFNWPVVAPCYKCVIHMKCHTIHDRGTENDILLHLLLTFGIKLPWWQGLGGQHGAHRGPAGPRGSHVGPVNFAIWATMSDLLLQDRLCSLPVAMKPKDLLYFIVRSVKIYFTKTRYNKIAQCCNQCPFLYNTLLILISSFITFERRFHCSS